MHCPTVRRSFFGMRIVGSQLQAQVCRVPSHRSGDVGRARVALLGPMEIAAMDLLHKNAAAGTTRLKSSATMWRPTVNCSIFQQCTGDRCNVWMNLLCVIMLFVCVCYVCESRAPALTLMAADFGLSGPSRSSSFRGKMHLSPVARTCLRCTQVSLSLKKIESTRIPNTIIHYTLLCTGYQHNQVHQSTGTGYRECQYLVFRSIPVWLLLEKMHPTDPPWRTCLLLYTGLSP